MAAVMSGEEDVRHLPDDRNVEHDTSRKDISFKPQCILENLIVCFAGLVALARAPTPDPIPNSAVKSLSADGTAAQASEE